MISPSDFTRIKKYGGSCLKNFCDRINRLTQRKEVAA